MCRVRIDRLAAALAIGLAVFCSSPSGADLSKKTKQVKDVSVKFRKDCDKAPESIILGDLDITLENTGDAVNVSNVMRGVFNVKPALQGLNSGGTGIWDCMKLHYVQMVTKVPVEFKRKGVAAEIPVIDPPRGGWDYMFAGPNGTGAVKPAYDVFVDDLPWYWNDKGEGKYFDLCKRYEINDNPTAFDAVVEFSTFLVATGSTTCPGLTDCLMNNEFLLLAGWQWSESKTDIEIPTTYDSSTFPVAALTTALKNAAFTDNYKWTAVKDKVLCCPEPGTWALVFSSTFVALGVLRRSRPGR